MALTKKELADRCNVDESKVDSWIESGLPGGPDGFDDEQVADWLVANELAGPLAADENEAAILKTRADVARLFQVNVRTVAEWMADPEFPGKAGERGKRNGHFPVPEIMAYKLKRDAASQPNQHSSDGEANSYREKMARLKFEQMQLEHQKREGMHVELNLVMDEVVRAHAIAKSVLRELPDLVVRELPTDMDPILVDQIRRSVEGISERSQVSIADQVEKGFGDDDE